MKVKINKFNDKAIIPYKTHQSDFCYDCVATSCEEVAPNVYKYGLGFGLQIDRKESVELVNSVTTEKNKGFDVFYGFYNSPINLDIDFRPRSSVWKTGMSLSNCEGTIDEGYINEISAVFYHVMPNMPKYEVGDRIGQIKIGMTFPMEFIEVDELNETDRGLGGFGSTGK